MSSLTIRIPERLRRDLEKLSRDSERPVSELVRDSLQRYLAVQKFRALRRQVISAAEARGYLTDDDVFKAVS